MWNLSEYTTLSTYISFVSVSTAIYTLTFLIHYPAETLRETGTWSSSAWNLQATDLGFENYIYLNMKRARRKSPAMADIFPPPAGISQLSKPQTWAREIQGIRGVSRILQVRYDNLHWKKKKSNLGWGCVKPCGDGSWSSWLPQANHSLQMSVLTVLESRRTQSAGWQLRFNSLVQARMNSLSKSVGEVASSKFRVNIHQLLESDLHRESQYYCKQ